MIPPFGRQHRPVALASRTHRLRFDPDLRRVLGLIGMRAATARVVVDPDRGVLDVRFGPWRVLTPLTNITSAAPARPRRTERRFTVVRPTPAPRDLVLATAGTGGVRIGFRHPVRVAGPVRPGRHTSLTLTPVDPQRLIADVLPDLCDVPSLTAS